MDNAVKISGKKLAELRRRRYMTQEEVAREMNLSKGRVSAIELKDSTGLYLKNFKNLAGLFKMSPDDLLRELAVDEAFTMYRIANGVLEGLKQRAATENSTLDEWLARQATLSLSVFDESDRVATPALKTVKQKKASGRGRRPKRAGSQGK